MGSLPVYLVHMEVTRLKKEQTFVLNVTMAGPLKTLEMLIQMLVVSYHDYNISNSIFTVIITDAKISDSWSCIYVMYHIYVRRMP